MGINDDNLYYEYGTEGLENKWEFKFFPRPTVCFEHVDQAVNA